jgi:hypothetical protein
VVSKDIFLRSFVINYLLELNERDGFGVYPSAALRNIIVSDVREPSERLVVISTVVRSGFRVFDLDDFSVRLKVLSFIFGLDAKELGKKVKPYIRDKLFNLCLMYRAKQGGLEDIVGMLGGESYRERVDKLVRYVREGDVSQFGGISYYYGSFGVLVSILEGLLTGKVEHGIRGDIKGMGKLMNFIVSVLRTESTEEALLSMLCRAG